uniref:MFS domain-containing protein n=1 Tax=Panagrellus redivivus TaxID=6233 RepID=A0A7E4VVT4_PANRE
MVAIVVSSNTESAVPKPTHTPELGGFIYILAFTSIIGGFLFGYDTGIVSAAMLYVKQNDKLHLESSLWQEIIVAITPGFAAIGSLCAGQAADRFGRKRIIVISTVIFAIGAIVCAAAIDRWILLVGRILLGFAIGLSSMIVPMYISEASPANIRGQLVTGFQLMVTLGLMLANVIAGGFAYIDPVNIGWRLMFGFAAVPAIIQYIGFLFLPESPRWLYQNKGQKEAEEVIKRIYNGDHAWIHYESEEIRVGIEAEAAEKAEIGDGSVLVRVWKTPHVRKALFIGCVLQGFQQLSGINTIMYYTGTIIKSTGVRDDHTSIWISVGTSAVNFLATLIPIFILERVGRRKMLFASVLGVAVSLFALATAFLVMNRESADVDQLTSNLFFQDSGFSLSDVNKCNSYKNCDFCVTDESCGFCSVNGNAKSGYCAPLDDDDRADVGYCSLTSLGNKGKYDVNGTTYEWGSVYCHTSLTVLPIILMMVYLACFAIGYAPLAWVLNAEFYPLWARSTCISLAVFLNWVFNLLVSLTFLSLSQAITKFGTFYLYGGITVIGFIFFYFTIPETSGCSIDEVEMLFKTKKAREEEMRLRAMSAAVDDIGKRSPKPVNDGFSKF